MKKAYVVTMGSYSDYSILGVFTDKSLAEQFIKDFEDQGDYVWSKPEIEEWPLNTTPQDWKRTVVGMYLDTGEVYLAETRVSGDFPDEDRDQVFSGGKQRPVFVSTVLTTDAERAVKVANERRLMWKAQNA